LLCGEHERHRAAQARSEERDFTWAALLHQVVGRPQIIDFAAASEIFELAARCADETAIEAQRRHASLC
jgi:hypothetical protein